MPRASQLLYLRDVKGNFFDRRGVQRAMDKATNAALRKAGGETRLRARRSMRPQPRPPKQGIKGYAARLKTYEGKAKHSSPGQPPFRNADSGKALIYKLMRFAWDPFRKSVVVGPLTNKRGRVPEVLEYGGTVQRWRYPDGTFTPNMATKRGLKKRLVQIRIAPRPFMRPALAKVMPTIPLKFRKSISKYYRGV